MLGTISILLLISIVHAHQVPFKSCAEHPSDDQTRLDIKTIDINPWPVKDGDAGSANFTIDLRKHLDQGSKYDLQIRYGHYLIVHQKGDLCRLDPSLTCPKEPNDNVQMLYHFTMPQLPVFGKLNLRIQIWDQDGLERKQSYLINHNETDLVPCPIYCKQSSRKGKTIEFNALAISKNDVSIMFAITSSRNLHDEIV